MVGATRTLGTVPHDIFQNILEAGYQGVVYPVSPRSPSISGVKAYKYVVDIPDPVDLAVIVFPSSVCHLAMEQCGREGREGGRRHLRRLPRGGRGGPGAGGAAQAR